MADAERNTGNVKWFNGPKGYGFIIDQEGNEVFVHHSEIQDDARRGLEDGQSVEFTLNKTDKGLQAKKVVRT